jgi:hypothetical protein
MRLPGRRRNSRVRSGVVTGCGQGIAIARMAAPGGDRDAAACKPRPASRHAASRRVHQIYVRCSQAEYDAIRAAAISAGLTPGGYAAEAALAAARASSLPTTDRRDVVIELMAARAQLRHYGSNLNQAARALNAGGDPPEWPNSAIALTDRVVHIIDKAVQEVLDPPPGLA